MNIIETRAVLNIVKTDGKWTPEGKREGLELIRSHVVCIGDAQSNYTEDRAWDRTKFMVFLIERKVNDEIFIK